jgi:Mrp family chromosome partitioning ATPase
VLDLAGVRGNTPGDLARVTARLLPRIGEIADSIVVDTSPVGATAEVLEFVPKADNIVVVVRLGHTTASTAQRSIETIRTLSRGNVLLVLVGGDASSGDQYYYYYSTSRSGANGGTGGGRFGRRRPGRSSPQRPAEETPVGS